MSLSSALFMIFLVWAVIHTFNVFLKPWTPTILPVNSSQRRYTRFYDEASTSVIVTRFHLKVQTTAWNVVHDHFAAVLKRRQYAQLRRWITKFYDFGSVMGVAGMICGVATLLWMVGSSTWDTFRLLYHSDESPAVSKLSKREILADTVSLHEDSHSLVQLIIPGVTVPVSHLPLILLAIFICQLVHELGHALSGALESVPILSAGFTINFIIPSAYVSFSSAFVDSLENSGRARIIAGGPWHNLLFWFILVGAGQVATMAERVSGMSSMLLSIGWTDVTMQGRVVVGLDDDSPLNQVLAVGSMITALDDVSLKNEADLWYGYLMNDNMKQRNDVPKGWCFPRDTFEESPQACCTQSLESPSSESALSCFSSLSTNEKRCLDPIIVLTSPKTWTRCTTDDECASSTAGKGICAQPDSSEAILRIAVQDEEIVLWNGPRNEVWEQVAISRFAPRFWFIPYSALGMLCEFWQYLGIATLSLYFFNLLPLPFLDGERFLSVILDIVMKSTVRSDSDEEAGPQSRRTRAGPWKRRIEHGLKLGTIWLLGICVVLALIK